MWSQMKPSILASRSLQIGAFRPQYQRSSCLFSSYGRNIYRDFGDLPSADVGATDVSKYHGECSGCKAAGEQYRIDRTGSTETRLFPKHVVICAESHGLPFLEVVAACCSRVENAGRLEIHPGDKQRFSQPGSHACTMQCHVHCLNALLSAPLRSRASSPFAPFQLAWVSGQIQPLLISLQKTHGERNFCFPDLSQSNEYK